MEKTILVFFTFAFIFANCTSNTKKCEQAYKKGLDDGFHYSMDVLNSALDTVEAYKKYDDRVSIIIIEGKIDTFVFAINSHYIDSLYELETKK